MSDYAYQGKQVGVCDSARNGILIIELFQDEELSPEEKGELLVRMLFPNPEQTVAEYGDQIWELIIFVIWEAFGLDVSADGRYATEHRPAVFDFEEDAARIRASLLQCFGIDWDEAACALSYADMTSLLGMLLEADTETPFQQAIYYRTAKPPKRNKHNGDYCDAFEERRKHFALSKKDTTTENETTAGMFAAAKRVAQRGA